jgi:hypothetical protein
LEQANAQKAIPMTVLDLFDSLVINFVVTIVCFGHAGDGTWSEVVLLLAGAFAFPVTFMKPTLVLIFWFRGVSFYFLL